jgi:hypothetical protein
MAIKYRTQMSRKLVAAEVDNNFVEVKSGADTATTAAASAASNAVTALALATDALAAANASVQPTRLVGGVPLSSDVSLKTIGGVNIVGTGDIPAPGGATTVDELTDKETIDLPVINTPLEAALAAKTDLFTAVNLGTGTPTLNYDEHANRHTWWNGSSDALAYIDSTGAPNGAIWEIANIGSALLTMSGPDAGTGYTNIIYPGTIGYCMMTNEGVISGTLDPSGSAGVPVPVTISGTPEEGEVLTALWATGWAGTLQWRESGADIGGETSSTYTVQVGDDDVTVTAAALYYRPPTLTITAGGGASGSIAFNNISPLVDENLTDDYDDWMTAYGVWSHKDATSLLGGPTASGGQTLQGWTNWGGTPHLTTNVGDVETGGGGAGTIDGYTGFDDGGSLTGKLSFTAPADIAPHLIRVWWGSAADATTARLRATLSDGSYAEQTTTVTNGRRTTDITYNAATDGQYITIASENAGASYSTFLAIAYRATP